jgi:hypothetical protein
MKGQRQTIADEYLLVYQSNLRTSFVTCLSKNPNPHKWLWHGICFKVLKTPHPIAQFHFTTS